MPAVKVSLNKPVFDSNSPPTDRAAFADQFNTSVQFNRSIDPATAQPRKKILQYPTHNFDKHNMWILFQTINYEEMDKPVDSNKVQNQVQPKDGSSVESKNILNIPSAGAGKKSLRSKFDQNGVALYMPGSIEVSDGASFGTVNLEAAGFALMKSLRAGLSQKAADTITGQQALDATIASGQQVLAPIQDLIKGISSNNVPVSTITKILQTTKIIGNNEISGGISAGLRHVANAHTHQIFESVSIRTFSFNFEFIPEDQFEAEEVRRIIQFFRETLYPTKAQGQTYDPNNEMTLRFPTMLDIKIGFVDPVTKAFKTEFDDGKPVAFKIKPCFITGVTTNFDNNNTLAMHPDGHFISSTLALQLTEETTLTREDIESGY